MSRPPLSWTVFHDVDRLCRSYANPAARHLYLRACCLLGFGETLPAEADLALAFAVDGTDIDIQGAILQVARDTDLIALAAHALVAEPFAGRRLRDGALAVLAGSRPLILSATRHRGGVSGRVAWSGREVPALWVGGLTAYLQAGPEGEGTSASFRVAWPDDLGPVEVTSRVGKTMERMSLGPIAAAPVVQCPYSDHVHVIVPIHGGREATVACLQALVDQFCAWPLQVTLVDDASPDELLLEHCRSLCRRQGWTLLAAPVNAGYAAAVRRGAESTRARFLLLLNADAILPPGAIDRLMVAMRHPGVGTVVPLSNDGGFTSFPSLRERNPCPTIEQAAAFDAAARRHNAGVILDIPSGTAFCMLVDRACWDAVGGLDPGYGRGYFEDVDFCLRAAQLGFRNVVAADIYVRHIGGQSFGPDKRALVARNATIIRARFPAYDASWSAFLDADPLIGSRAAIEEAVHPDDPIVVLAGRSRRCSAAIGLRAAAARARGLHALVLDWSPDGAVVLRAFDGGLPQNLRFAPRQDGVGPPTPSCLSSLPGEADSRGPAHDCLMSAAAALADYLGRCVVATVEILEPHALPGWLPAVLAGLDAPLVPVVGDRAAVRFLRSGGGGWLDAENAVALDGLCEAVLRPCGTDRDVVGSARPVVPQTGAAGSGAPRIAALAPVPTLAAERLIASLDAALRRDGGEVVTFGPGARPDGAAARVTGPMVPDDYPDALRRRAITHLLLPDPDTPYGLLEGLPDAGRLPAAFHDWSAGRLTPRPGDLALDEAASAQDAVRAILAWCRPGEGTAAPAARMSAP